MPQVTSSYFKSLSLCFTCRNRHYPKCQGIEREQWVLKQQANSLEVNSLLFLKKKSQLLYFFFY
ncbi:transposase zinc-binding domain-containing protein [Halocella sp. SP3-1]|uniref:transposase zinc-binding domain-containing protein n=1 Tax=Halocella sp. SP3-1 TaxID=2382161 RepID=UPI000F755AB5|nr:hypothetical protein D7D81_09995 [Halocella sp. SP3-1]